MKSEKISNSVKAKWQEEEYRAKQAEARIKMAKNKERKTDNMIARILLEQTKFNIGEKVLDEVEQMCAQYVVGKQLISMIIDQEPMDTEEAKNAISNIMLEQKETMNTEWEWNAADIKIKLKDTCGLDTNSRVITRRIKHRLPKIIKTRTEAYRNKFRLFEWGSLSTDEKCSCGYNVWNIKAENMTCTFCGTSKKLNTVKTI